MLKTSESAHSHIDDLDAVEEASDEECSGVIMERMKKPLSPNAFEF